jgi:hypothetical protein
METLDEQRKRKTHSELINITCEFFRRRVWACLPEVKVWNHSVNSAIDVIPDIIAIKRDYLRKSISIFEIKISRADFLSDVRKQKYLKSMPFASKFYYVCPWDLIQPEEVPDGIGLYYVEDKYTGVCVKSAKAKKVILSENVLWSMILSFEKNLRR